MQGFVIPVPQKYEQIAIANIKSIRNKFKIDTPVEIWEAGSEISDAAREDFKKMKNIIFRNVSEYTDDLKHWKGFQIKAFAAYYTSFDEFIVCDSDIQFFQNPLTMFNDVQYKETGCFFFRDLKWYFYNLNKEKNPKDKFSSKEHYLDRCKWLRKILPEPGPYFPKEWLCMYEEKVPDSKILEAYMEAGVMYYNKEKMQKALKIAFDLNDNHEETYKYVWGDKETWWLACCINGQPFGMNKKVPVLHPPLTHYYKGKRYFMQKEFVFKDALIHYLKLPLRKIKNLLTGNPGYNQFYV